MSRAARGFGALSAWAISASKVHHRYGSRDVERLTGKNEDRAKRSAVDYLNGVLIACPGEVIFGPLYPSRVLQFRGTPRPRGALAAGARAQGTVPGPVGTDLVLSGLPYVYFDINCSPYMFVLSLLQYP